jgi:hypothetical protein
VAPLNHHHLAVPIDLKIYFHGVTAVAPLNRPGVVLMNPPFTAISTASPPWPH